MSRSHSRVHSYRLWSVIKCLALGIVAWAVLVSTVWAQSGRVFDKVEPFDGARYGMSFDTSTMDTGKGGQPCVEFDEKKMYAQQDGVSTPKSEKITTSSELTKTLKISALAQFNSLTGNYAAGSTLEMLNKTEIHEYSQTQLYWNYKRDDMRILMAEAISLKPEFVDLLKQGVEGKDKFRERCGNTFVVGMQTGAYYYGTVFTKSRKENSQSTLNLNFNFETSSIGKVVLKGGFEKDQVEKISRDEEKVAVSTTIEGLQAPEKLDEVKDQWKTFSPTGGEGKLIQVMVAPYTLAKNAPNLGRLGQSTSETKLETMVSALWDLKSLREEAAYILAQEDRFALGIPGGSIRKQRYDFVRSLSERWIAESNSLLDETKECVKSYTEDCGKLADWYESHPRLAERKHFPKKYRSYCYGILNVTPTLPDPMDQPKWIRLGSEFGEGNHHEGPVDVGAELKIVPAGRQLKGVLTIKTGANYKNRRSTFKQSTDITIFDLNPPNQEMGDVFEECDYNGSMLITGSNGDEHPKLGGYVERRGFMPAMADDNGGLKGWERINATANDNGLLRGLECQLVFKGSDIGKVKCRSVDVTPFRVNLYNRLDREAEKGWKGTPCLPGAPTIKNIGTWKDTSCEAKGGQIKNVDIKGKPFKK